MDLRCRLIKHLQTSWRQFSDNGMGGTVNNFYLRRVRGGNERGVRGDVSNPDFRAPPPNVNLPGLGFWRGGSNIHIPHREKLRRGQNCCLHFLNVPHAYTPRKGWWLYKDLLNSSHILWVPSDCLPHVLKKAAVAQLSPLKDCCVTSLWWPFRHQHIEQPAPGAS